MRLSKLLSSITVLLAAALAFSACASPVIQPATATAALPAPERATATTAPTRTPVPTETSRPSPTPASTETPLPQATPTLTPDPALKEVKLIGMAWLSNYNLLLSFQFPMPVDPSQYRVTLEDKEYQCEVLAKYPDRLYCHGQGAKVLTVADVRLYPADSQQPAFEKDLWIPFFTNDYTFPAY